MTIELLVPRPRLVVPKPKSYVKLDMAFGVGAGTTLYDKSRYRSHGAITGASWATGLHGKCLDFDSTIPSYVEIPAAHTQLNFTSEDFSIIARVYLDDLTDARAVFARGLRVNQDGYSVIINSSGGIEFWTFQDGAYQYTISTYSINTATHYTIGVSRDGAVGKVFLNGVDITLACSGHKNPKTSSQNAYIGVVGDKVRYPFDGKMEFLRVFGGIALSASEHLAWHNALA